MRKLSLVIIILVLLLAGFIYKATISGAIFMPNNPLLKTEELPIFADIKPTDFAPAIAYVLNNFDKVLWHKVLTEKNPSWENTVLPLEEASDKIDRVWKLITHLNSIANTAEIRQAYDQVLPKITAFNSEVMQNAKLYQAYLSLKENKTFKTYNQTQKTIIKHAIRNFQLAGVNLPEQKGQHLKQIRQRLSELGNQFAKNVIDATQAWDYHVTPENEALLAGLPEHTIAIAKEKALQGKKPGWILSLDHPCFYAVLTFAKDSELRKTFYTAYHTRASDQGPMANHYDNTKLIAEMLALKQELATLLGYNNYAEYSLVSKMAKNTEQVMTFLVNLITHSKPFAEQEFAELANFAKEKYKISTLNAWDVSYYSELYQQEHYQISQEMLRPYFPEPQVLSGMFKLAERLFSIKIQEVPNSHKWHDSVKLFAITDQDGNLRGKFYTDLYVRDFKRSGAWMADFLSRIRFANGVLQTPVAFLEANFTPPANGKPALLSHDEVLTLFHEFGHALHHVLTQVDYPSVAGTNGVAWDAVELPSQFMENWCWEWEVIQELSKHYQTGASLPKADFDKLLAIKNFHSAMQMMRQLEFALFDFRLHLNQPADQGKTAQQIIEEVRTQVAVIPIPAFNRFQNSFTHIFDSGYDAGYFSYKWAEVLSSDAFEKFKENGTFNETIGKEFLHTILEQGGSREAMDLFIEFRGRKPTIDALLKHNGIGV